MKENKIQLDAGYFFGYGVFETIHIHKDRPIFLAEHLRRLNTGLKTLEIEKEIKEEEVLQAISMLNCRDQALKINVTSENTLFTSRPITYTKEDYEKGAKLTLSSVLKNPTSKSLYLKSMNYMDNIIELKAAKSAGFQDVLFLNYRNEVCETAVANIFMIKDDKILTPKISSGILKGVMRNWLIDQYNLEEKILYLDDLYQSDGVFISNSLMGMMKVTSIDEQLLKESPTINDIYKRYQSDVLRE